MEKQLTESEFFDLASYADEGRAPGVLDSLKAYQKDSKEQGGLMLQTQGAMALGVSSPRMAELIKEGTIQTFEHFGKRLVGGDQILAWGKLQKCSGPKGAHIKALFVSQNDCE